MASLIGGSIQTIFAAVSFSAAGYLFKAFDKNGHDDEIKRHNKALEDLQKAKGTFYHNEVKQHDRIQQLREQLVDAKNDIVTTDKALDQLRQVQTIQYNGKTFNREPQLNDFYHPSDEMKEYQYIAIGVIGVGSGYLLTKMI